MFRSLWNCRKWTLVVLCGLLLSSCATYQRDSRSAQQLIEQGQPAKAAELLKPLAFEEGDDQLVYLLDYAVAEQLAGNYQDSNRALLVANDLAVAKDYISLARQTGSLLLSEGMVQYKGDPFEIVLINAMLAINFIMLGDFEAASVEARRINQKLELFQRQAKKGYEQSAFAVYLAALLWEKERQWDDAYIDYEKAYQLDPKIELLKADLLRVSRLAGRSEETKNWQKAFNRSLASVLPPGDHGEVVLIYQQGWGPRKRPRPEAPRFPKLYPTSNRTQQARIKVSGQVQEAVTESIYNVSEVAVRTLDDAYAGLVAKRVAGMVAKEVVAHQISQKNELLGAVVRLGLTLSDQADLRQWSTLPASFQVARMYLPPGKYDLAVEGLDSDGRATGESKVFAQVEVKRQRMSFLAWRSLK